MVGVSNLSNLFSFILPHLECQPSRIISLQYRHCCCMPSWLFFSTKWIWKMANSWWPKIWPSKGHTLLQTSVPVEQLWWVAYKWPYDCMEGFGCNVILPNDTLYLPGELLGFHKTKCRCNSCWQLLDLKKGHWVHLRFFYRRQVLTNLSTLTED